MTTQHDRLETTDFPQGASTVGGLERIPRCEGVVVGSWNVCFVSLYTFLRSLFAGLVLPSPSSSSSCLERPFGACQT